MNEKDNKNKEYRETRQNRHVCSVFAKEKRIIELIRAKECAEIRIIIRRAEAVIAEEIVRNISL